MKDYSLCKQGNSDYIVDIFVDSNDTYTVVFADGRRFRNIEVTKENLEKVKKAQEEQAKRGLSNLGIFKSRKTKSGFATFMSGIGAGALAYGATYIPTIQEAISTQNPVLIAAGIGTVAVLGAIPCFTRFVKNKGIVQELEKIKYRNQHRKDLDRFREYPNSLAGINGNTRAVLLSEKDPFSIINVDDFTEEDLKQIISNIHSEEGYQFTYSKKQSKSK